ncbi:unnamed protein product [Urochloa humidicola]
MGSAPEIPPLLRNHPVARQAAKAAATKGKATADQEAMGGAPADDDLRPRPVLSEQEAKFCAAMILGFKAAASTNVEGWMVIDGMLYACTTTVLNGTNLEDLVGSWDTWAIVVYGLTKQVVICLLAGGFMALCGAYMMGSSSNSYRLYRSISSICARFGFILCIILLQFYTSSAMGRLGWIAGLVFSVVAGGTITGLWIWAEKRSVAAEAAPAP